MIYYYPNKETFDGFAKPDFNKYSGNVVVWGAGKIGGMAAHCLKKRGVQVCAFCDVAKDKWGTEFCGYEVISPEQLYEKYPNAAVVISTVFHTVIFEELKQKGYVNVFDCTSLFLEIDFAEYDFWMLPDYAIRNVEQYMAAIYEQLKKEREIDQIFLNITTKCSLRCKDCSMYIPYVKEPRIYDADVIMKDFKNVLDCLGHVRIVNFYGGEPLLHPDLAKMIVQLKEEKRIERISIITNATIVPSEELLSALEKESRIMMRISDYGPLSSKLNEIEQLLLKHKIKYEVANYTYWDTPGKVGLYNETENQLKAKFRLCTMCNMLFLLNRKLYMCSAGSAIGNIGAFPPCESNYVDVGKHEDNHEELKADVVAYIERIQNKDYLDACKYCSGVHSVQFENKVPVAEQTREVLEFEKVY